MSQQSEQEAALIRSLHEGNEAALRIIFDSYYEKLCLYAESFTRDHQQAEEITDDLFIYLWVNNKSLSITTSLKNYLFRSIHNNCINYLDKLKTTRKLIDQSTYVLEDEEILHSHSQENPDLDLICLELQQQAEKILESLPSQCKKIYLLNRFENRSYTEISSQLGISVGTVKTQMSRAFYKLRKGLKEFLPLLIALFSCC